MTRSVLLALTTLFSSSWLPAADVLDQLAPSQSEERLPERPKSVDKSDSGAVDEDEVLLEALLGIIIAKEGDKTSVARDFSGVQVLGYASEKLAPLAQRFVGKPVSLEDLKGLESELEAALQTAEHPLVDVYLPPQEITSGVIQYAVRERSLGNIQVTGNRRIGGTDFNAVVRSQPNQPLDPRVMAEDLQWLNLNPFRRVDLIYRDGKTPLLADAELKVTDQRPWRLFTGMNNYSSERLGDDRWLLGAQHGNLWGLGHESSAQILRSLDGGKLAAVAGNYRMPLPGRNMLEISGLTSESDVQLPNEVDLTGENWRLGVSLERLFPAWGDLRHQLSIGFERLGSSYQLAAADGRTLDRSSEMLTLNLGYTASWADTWGYTTADLGLDYSPGGGGADQAEYEALRAGSDTTFAILRGRVDRIWWLPADFSLLTRAAWQATDTPLLSAQRMTVTGQAEVRGYDESAAFADQAIRLTAELRSNSYQLINSMRVQGVAFWDAAWLDNVGNSQATAQTQLHGVGIGTRIQIAKMLSVRADVAWPLEDLRSGLAEDSPRWHLGATVSF
jgi:hemolysin activation/secretion protein